MIDHKFRDKTKFLTLTAVTVTGDTFHAKTFCDDVEHFPGGISVGRTSKRWCTLLTRGAGFTAVLSAWSRGISQTKRYTGPLEAKAAKITIFQHMRLTGTFKSQIWGRCMIHTADCT